MDSLLNSILHHRFTIEPSFDLASFVFLVFSFFEGARKAPFVGEGGLKRKN